MRFFFLIFASLALLGLIKAECPNACSGHGDCSKFDMCECYRNWQSSDCSERTCQFGLAHVDTPKGDLDMSGGALDGPTSTVVEGSMVYPYGTQEQFPNMAESDGTVVTNTAHYYMECSNKGLCNRKDGECECFEGYEGSSCQRASCPNECSGHGVCKNIRQIAEDDASNYYELWDKYATLGCVCDSEYYGADCSARQCKFGVDPLYSDDTNPRYETVTVELNGDGADPSGDFSITFYDVFGENWETDAITVSADACDDIVAALEGIPNNVIPADSVTCSYTDGTNEHTFTLAFMGNPGALKPIVINEHLSGNTATLTVDSIEIYSHDTRGEFTDVTPTYCDGVTVSVASTGVVSVENTDGGSDNSNEVFALKNCLGTADYDDDTNQDVQNWDVGTDSWPHLVRLAENGDTDGGYYTLLQFDDSADTWAALHDVGTADGTSMDVYTTDATMELVYFDADSSGHWSTNDVAVVIEAASQGATSLEIDADVSCEFGASTISNCLQKGDVITVTNSAWSDGDVTGEFFTITRVWETPADRSSNSLTYWISVDHAINMDITDATIHVLTTGDETYEYVSECSNRGLCNSEEGLCECFKGYTNDNCDMQSAIAV